MTESRCHNPGCTEWNKPVKLYDECSGAGHCSGCGSSRILRIGKIEAPLPVHADFNVEDSTVVGKISLAPGKWNLPHCTLPDALDDDNAKQQADNNKGDDVEEWMEQRDAINSAFIKLRGIADDVGALIISDKLMELNRQLADTIHYYYGMGD